MQLLRVDMPTLITFYLFLLYDVRRIPGSPSANSYRVQRSQFAIIASVWRRARGRGKCQYTSLSSRNGHSLSVRPYKITYLILSLDFTACPKYFALVLQHNNASYQSHILVGTACIGNHFQIWFSTC